MAIDDYVGPELRRDARVRRVFPLPIHVRDSAQPDLLGSGEAWVQDLSVSGMCIALPASITQLLQNIDKSRACLEFQLPIDQQTFSLSGRPVWVQQTRPAASSRETELSYVGMVFDTKPLAPEILDRVLGMHPVPMNQSKEQLAALLEVSHMLTSSLDQNRILQLILDTVSRLFRADGSSLLLVDAYTNEMTFYVPFGAGSEKLRDVRLKPGEGIAGWVAKQGRPLIVNDVQHDPRFCSNIDTLTGYATRSMMAVPLLDTGRVAGVIEVLNTKKEKQFSGEDLELLSALAAHASMALRNARLFSTIREEKDYLQETVEERYRVVVGESPVMQEAVGMAHRAAEASATVLLLGESGTGKEVFARSIHSWSGRARKPFRAVNCVALSEHLLESELFGHEKGAFTGAHQQKKGLFELADGGTLFLDEIGDMKPELQAKLLRVLQDRTFERVGGTQPIRVNVRVIAATNQDLESAVKAGKFRKDLFYRLNVVTISLPPLRKRKDDIPALGSLFLARYNRELKRRVTLSSEALALLQEYDWPGNVRELENVLERAVVLALGPEIKRRDIESGMSNRPEEAGETPASLAFHDAIECYKRELIQIAIGRAAGRKQKAAELLGLNPTYLSRLCRQLHID